MTTFIPHFPLLLLWVIFLIPLSVDHHLGFDAGNYTLRGSYFTFAALIVYLFAKHRTRFLTEIFSFLTSQTGIAFLVLLIAGAVGAITSSVLPDRALYFWVWTAGTLLVVIPTIRVASLYLPKNAGTGMAIAYLVLQCCIVCIDGIICPLSHGLYSIGSTQLYGVPGHALTICRPTAFYQEPSYFSSFALLMLGTVWQFPWKSWLPKALTVNLIVAAVLLSSSRLGVFGVVIIGSHLILSNSGHDTSSKIRRLAAYAGGIAISILILSQLPLTSAHIISGLKNPTRQLIDRMQSFQASLNLWKKYPLFGVGPGNSRAVLNQIQTASEQVQNGLAALPDHIPLNMSIFSELLSEWGAIGALAFLWGLFQLSRKYGTDTFIFIGFCLAALTNQTLQRMDFWVAIALYTQARWPTKQNPSTMTKLN